MHRLVAAVRRHRGQLKKSAAGQRTPTTFSQRWWGWGRQGCLKSGVAGEPPPYPDCYQRESPRGGPRSGLRSGFPVLLYQEAGAGADAPVRCTPAPVGPRLSAKSRRCFTRAYQGSQRETVTAVTEECGGWSIRTDSTLYYNRKRGI